MYDVTIIGGGPGGLAAALALGRARKRVLLLDGGPRRNARAAHVHNFVTRDGTPPDEFRAVGQAQLTTYPNVEVRPVAAEAISGERGAFVVRHARGDATTRRILLCTGMLDDELAIEGLRERWGHAVFQCPYCHGWEVQDRPWGFLVQPLAAAHLVLFALQARGWTRDLTVFTGGEIALTAEQRATLHAAAVRVEETPIARLRGAGHTLEAIDLIDGRSVPCVALFTHPPQQQVGLVRALVASHGLALDADGLVKTDPMTRETSVAGIYAAGDLTTRQQGAILAAAAATLAATMVNVELTSARVLAGEL